MNDEPIRSMSLPELVVVSVVAVLLVAGAVFVWRTDPKKKNDAHVSITATLTRIESAKTQFAANNRLPDGTYVTLSTLQKEGYVHGSGEFPTDIHFVPGKVGENTTYHFADGSHKDHSAPPQ
ncbi:MAG: hypothetical protein H8F28_02735 [Fibrella sp.]|nr:hypothetical protein [Armatimonadota bacterium]